jgi:hypothetical protein
MNGFNSIPVDSAGTTCQLFLSPRCVDNAPGHPQPEAVETSRENGRTSLLNTANTSGCDGGVPSLSDKSQQRTS